MGHVVNVYYWKLQWESRNRGVYAHLYNLCIIGKCENYLNKLNILKLVSSSSGNISKFQPGGCHRFVLIRIKCHCGSIWRYIRIYTWNDKNIYIITVTLRSFLVLINYNCFWKYVTVRCSNNLAGCSYYKVGIKYSLYPIPWSLTLREERTLRVIENRVLRRIFGPKRDGVTGEWWKLHNEELNDLYFSPSTVRVIKSRRLRWSGHVARIEEGRGVHKVLVGKPEVKRPLESPRRRWEDNTKMYL